MVGTPGQKTTRTCFRGKSASHFAKTARTVHQSHRECHAKGNQPVPSQKNNNNGTCLGVTPVTPEVPPMMDFPYLCWGCLFSFQGLPILPLGQPATFSIDTHIIFLQSRRLTIFFKFVDPPEAIFNLVGKFDVFLILLTRRRQCST